jgi:hypothetical protein
MNTEQKCLQVHHVTYCLLIQTSHRFLNNITIKSGSRPYHDLKLVCHIHEHTMHIQIQTTCIAQPTA